MPDTLTDQIIQSLTYSKLRVTFEALEDIRFSHPYKGSAFRGSLLNTFMKNACLLEKPPRHCNTCTLRHGCLYHRFNANDLPAGHPLFGRYTMPPRAYIIDPVPDSAMAYDNGQFFGFDLILIGNAAGQFSPFLRSIFTGMGRQGIGIERGRFKLLALQYADGADTFHNLPAIGLPMVLSLSAMQPKPVSRSVTLRFETPVRFVSGGKPLTDPPEFDLLIKSLLTRLALLSIVYCNSGISDFEKHVKEIQTGVALKSEQLQWEGIISHSASRQREGDDALYDYNGHTGVITYAGRVAPWAALLNAGELLHVGSTATFGLGKYSIVQDG